MKCPNCNSNETQLEKRGFKPGDACGGAICFGPLGLLCGTMNSNKLSVHCSKCGHNLTKTIAQKKRKSDWSNLFKRKKKAVKESKLPGNQKTFWSNLFKRKKKVKKKSLKSTSKRVKQKYVKATIKRKKPINPRIFKIGNVFLWIFSIIFMFAAIGGFLTSILLGVITLSISLMLFPPFIKFLEKNKIFLKPWMRISILIILLAMFGLISEN